ncbi:FtsW/RodA/SpoVE family cell cycle protein [Candidatus Saccharibacteria bacterium]|nr:FtsW/RodA/SpoVE family cell cycle protein [Candidatus Saccharibacteria bacterium]
MRELAFRRRGATKATGEPDLIRRHRPDYLLIVAMVFLMMLGLVVLYGINVALSQRYENDNFALKQVIFLGLGVAVFVAASRLPLRLLEKYATKVLLAGVVASVVLAGLALVGSSLALCSGGACRWYNFGFTSFQPAELLKFGLLLYLAVFLSAKARMGQLNNIRETLAPAGFVVGVLTVLVVVLQKDMGTGLVVIAIALSMLLMAGVKARYMLGILGLMAAAGLLFIVTAPHRMARVLTFINHETSSEAADYHIEQALLAIGSGGFFGNGLGQSKQAFGYLPEAANDSIFAIMGETFGFIGTFIILVAFSLLIYRLLLILQQSQRPELRLIMAGMVAWFGVQAMINISSMIGLIPLTGITLPFLSFGGTSLIFTMLLMGIAFNISHYTSYRSNSNPGASGGEDSSSRRRVGRSRNARSQRLQRA